MNSPFSDVIPFFLSLPVLNTRIPNCKLKVLPGAGHAGQIEQPTRFVLSAQCSLQISKKVLHMLNSH